MSERDRWEVIIRLRRTIDEMEKMLDVLYQSLTGLRIRELEDLEEEIDKKHAQIASIVRRYRHGLTRWV